MGCYEGAYAVDLSDVDFEDDGTSKNIVCCSESVTAKSEGGACEQFVRAVRKRDGRLAAQRLHALRGRLSS